MLPELYEAQHHSQQVGFEGEDLKERHRRIVLTNSQAISGNSVIPVDSDWFHVASQTHMGQNYLVDTWAAICDCPDFPRIWLCKHLAAVQSKSLPPSQESQSNQVLSQNVFQHLSQGASTSFLSGEVAQVSEEGEATDVLEPGTQSGALPNRECLMQTCNLWKKTAQNMHTTCQSPKWHQLLAPDLPNSMTQHIGPIGKCKLIFTDPYSGGEQSGKQAKADAHFCSLATSEATSEGQNI